MNQIMIGSQMIDYEVIRKNILHTYLRIVDNHFSITTNPHTSEEELRKFIKKNESKLILRLNQKDKIPLYSNQFIELFGSKIPLVIQSGSRNFMSVKDGIAQLTCKEENQIHRIIERFYQREVIKESKEYLLKLSPLGITLLPKEGLVIKAQLMKSRFGSCHIKKKIVKMNSILGRFEKKYLHSTLCHEIVHFKIKGHQKNFYKLLIQLDPEYKKTNQELKNLVHQYEV